MEPQDELTYNNELTHVTLSEFLNVMYDMHGEINLEYGIESAVTDKLRELLERKKMGGNRGIHMSYEEEGE